MEFSDRLLVVHRVERRDAAQPGERKSHQLRDVPLHLGGEHAELPLREPEHREFRSEEHTSELQSLAYLVCRLLLEKKNRNQPTCVLCRAEYPTPFQVRAAREL